MSQGEFMFSIVLNFHFYTECVSHVPEITSIILKISRPLKLVLLFSELFDVKIAGVFTRRRARPSGVRFTHANELLLQKPALPFHTSHTLSLPLAILLRFTVASQLPEPGLYQCEGKLF